MKVLLVSYYFPPHGGGGVLRAADTARFLAAKGWEVTVLAGPEDGWWVRDESLTERVPDSVRVIRTRPSGLGALFGALGKGGGARREGGVRALKRLAAWLPVVDCYSFWARSAMKAAQQNNLRPRLDNIQQPAGVSACCGS